MEKRKIRKFEWRGKKYTYYHDMIEFIEGKYGIKERGFLKSEIFKTGENTLKTLSEEDFKKYLELSKDEYIYLDFWHWYIDNYATVNRNIKTKKLNFDSMIEKAKKQKTWEVYAYNGNHYTVGVEWIIAILRILKKEFGEKIDVSFEWVLF